MEGRWREGRLPICAEALKTYQDWKHVNAADPTKGKRVKQLKALAKEAGLRTTTRKASGQGKKGYKWAEMGRAELVTTIVTALDEELATRAAEASHHAIE